MTTRPNFLIVGAAKAGTSSLHNYLAQHPSIYLPAQLKESNFLCDLGAEPYPGLRRRFSPLIQSVEAYDALFEEVGDEAAVGEACPSYLYYHRQTIPRIHALLGAGTRIILVLREPADRAYSGYLHALRDGDEILSFADALAAEPQRTADGWWWGYHYRKVGNYAEQVQAYLDAFGRENVLITLYDDFRTDSATFLRRILLFLGVDERIEVDTSERYNATGIPKSRTLHHFLRGGNPLKKAARLVLPPATRQRLYRVLMRRNLGRKPPLPLKVLQQMRSEYMEEITALELLIDRDLTIWRDPRVDTP